MTEELITPRQVVENYLKKHSLSKADVAVAPTVVLSWGWGVIPSLAEKTGAARIARNIHGKKDKCFNGEVEGVPVTFVEQDIGAPGTITHMEQMIACGAEKFIAIGWTGALQLDIPIGSMVIPTSCIREEGTSFHYVDGDASLSPDSSLKAALIKAAEGVGVEVTEGPLWTTDAPYRELKSKVEKYREDGVIGVDMETSAMYALGQFRGTPVCNLLVVSDVLGAEWTDGFFTEEMTTANKAAEDIILDSISRL